MFQECPYEEWALSKRRRLHTFKYMKQITPEPQEDCEDKKTVRSPFAILIGAFKGAWFHHLNTGNWKPQPERQRFNKPGKKSMVNHVLYRSWAGLGYGSKVRSGRLLLFSQRLFRVDKSWSIPSYWCLYWQLHFLWWWLLAWVLQSVFPVGWIENSI